jgi:hypothetical protein
MLGRQGVDRSLLDDASVGNDDVDAPLLGNHERVRSARFATSPCTTITRLPISDERLWRWRASARRTSEAVAPHTSARSQQKWPRERGHSASQRACSCIPRSDRANLRRRRRATLEVEAEAFGQLPSLSAVPPLLRAGHAVRSLRCLRRFEHSRGRHFRERSDPQELTCR